MVEDHRVDDKARLGGRQAVVAELGGEHRLQGRVVRDLVKNIAESALGMAEKPAPHPRPGDQRSSARQGFLGKKGTGAADCLAHDLQVAVDGLGLVRKIQVHAVAPGFAPGNVLPASISDNDGVVDVTHRLPMQAAVTDVVEEARWT